MVDTGKTPPKGFDVSTGDRGELVVRYRTTGMGRLVVFFTLWFTFWTLGVGTCTLGALFDPGGVNWGMLLFLTPFWMIEIAMALYAAWCFRSVTVFVFEPDQLLAERSLLWCRRRHVFPRQGLVVVKQVKDGGEDDSFPSWGLALVGEKEEPIISRQPIEKSDWLGPIVAEWAGVDFQPVEAAKRRM